MWYPLSEAGRYTYLHSSGLIYGERYRFVPRTQPWATEVYEAADYGEFLEPAEVARLYGQEAAARARPDRKTVQFVLSRCS